ncbi:MAG: hypothetical protein HYZ31_05625 [Gammaproteobacteria bacterium]|nr:hypothetical protein [Gammaproteobacteria bacterium]
MNDKVRKLLQQISGLEDELRAALLAQKGRVSYHIQGKRIAFECAIREAHQKLKVGIFRWLLSIPLRNLLTAPIIYSMIVPLVLTDIFVTIYQVSCFPVYGIPKIRRKDYITFDHQHLAYLNIIEKFHCLYCSYANGLIAYVREITARTEQYFCPIKHAQKMLGTHHRYPMYLEYGEADDFQVRLDQFRSALAQENEDNVNQDENTK